MTPVARNSLLNSQSQALDDSICTDSSLQDFTEEGEVLFENSANT